MLLGGFEFWLGKILVDLLIAAIILVVGGIIVWTFK